ncbi:MAG TPA: penicillin-binding protein activator [Rhodanobacteraceae bacterium]
MRVLRLSSLLLVLALAGCVTTSTRQSPQQTAAAQQAQSLFNQGQYTQAAQGYLGIAAQYPTDSNHYRLLAAEAWREAKSPAQMTRTLGLIQRDQLSPADAQHYDLLEAEVALKQGNPARTLALTQSITDILPDALQRRALELRARALVASGKPWQAAHVRIALDGKLTGDAQAKNQARLVKLLGSLGVAKLQQHAAALPPDDSAQPWIARALAQLGAKVATPALPLNQAVGTFLPGSSQIEGYVLPQKVALILPLSGPLTAAGDTVRQGFFASYFQASGNGNLPPVTVYDTTGTPAGAVAAYQQAVAAGATQVVGPLTHAAVNAILQLPQLPAAVLALNHPDDHTVPPANVTEFGLRPEVGAEQAARYMQSQGLTQAVVLVSSEGFAQRAASAFTTQFTGAGGQILDTVTLDPAEVDYAQQIAALHIGDPKTTGIFISMRPEQARLLLPQLHLAKINLPVFATSHVYAANDNQVADGDLNGVTFCDAPWLFDAQPGLPPRSALAALSPAARGTSARLYAFGMDAWSLVPYLGFLRNHPGSYLPGATGRLTEDAFGHIQRRMIWARFDNGLAHPLNGSLQMGSPMTQPAAASSAPTLPAAATSPAQPASAATVPAGQ